MKKSNTNKLPVTKKSTVAGKSSTTSVNGNIAWSWIALISIVFLGTIIYSNSFNCSFQLDDKHNIIDNETIRDLTNLKGMWEIGASRIVAFYSFALNYHFGELNVWGYHFVNLIIHLINSFLVYKLVALIFSSPAVKNNTIARQGNSIALVAALLFLTHPLATGAVTYIVQRMASMVAMFYLLSIFCYGKARMSQGKSKYALFTGSFLSAMFAFFTKENAYTLPFALVLFEIYFIQTGKLQVNVRKPSTYFVLLGFIGFVAFVFTRFSFNVLAPLAPTKYNAYEITSENYFYTQLNVLVKYIQLLIVPVNQNLDYDFPLSRNLFEWPTFLNGLLLLSLLGLGVFLYNKNRLLSFGIVWFFLTMAIESSFIPITDLIFEHRTYLPSFGYFLLLATLLYMYLWEKQRNLLLVVVFLMIGINTSLAYSRNKVWKDELTMWTDVVAKSPNKARAYMNRGYAYGNKQQWPQAIADFTKVNEINPNYHAAAYYNLGMAYWTLGQREKSLQNYSQACVVDTMYADAYYGRAVAYFYMNEPDKAFDDYTKVIRINPRYDKAYFSRGIIYANQQRWAEAIADYSKAIDINPNNTVVLYNRGIVYGNSNQWELAVADFNKVLELDPQNKSAASNREFALSKLKTQ